MSNSKRGLMPIILILMLVLQLMSPISVLADGETPSDPPTTEETPPPEEPTDTGETPVEEATPTEDGAAVEEPVAEVTPSPEGDEVTETPPAEEASSAEEPTGTEEAPASEPTEEPAPEPEAESVPQVEDLSMAEVLEQAPAETEIVVVNEEGQVEPMVTEEAAEIVAEADPIWCPDGVTPQDGLNGCSPSFTSATAFSELITWLQTNDPDADGTIWIEKGYDSASEGVDLFGLNGNGFTNFDAHSLTIQGGWDGLGTTTVDNSNPSTFTGDRIRIVNWGNDVTINNILITGTSGEGLTVTTTGDINLNYVTSQNNLNTQNSYGRGARLNNESGNGKVTVQNSSFSNNEDTGLRIVSNGNITLANVTADSNGWRGVALDNMSGDGTVSVNSSIFTNNTAIGLTIFSSGDTNGDNLTINDNGRTGLLIASYSDITLNNVISTENGRDGAETYGSSIMIQNSQFNENDGLGLYASTFFFEIPPNPELITPALNPAPVAGSITLNQVTANANGMSGAILEAAENITVANSQFNGNGANAVPDCSGGTCAYEVPYGGIGLAAASWLGTGQIQLNRVKALNNYSHGAFLIGDDVVVRNSAFHNNGIGLSSLGGNDLWADGLYIEHNLFSSVYVECTRANGNAAYGIEIVTGDIILNSVSASDNGWDNFNLQSDTLNIFGEPCRDPKTIPALPWQIVPITGGENIGLNCSAYAGTVLILPNGDEIRLPCPTIGDGNLASVANNDLPGSLPEGNSYVSSFTAQVVQGGVYLDTLPAPMIVSFVIPEDMLDANLAILYWNSSEWTEVPGAYKTDDGRFEVSVDFTGTFVLVSK